MDNRTPTPIIVIAYNRPKSLARLLDSLARARYPSTDIPLIISIDKGDNNRNIFQIATEFNWLYGNKEVVYQKTNLGLRNHVLQCGNKSLEYGSAIILEDDLYVSSYFYYYTLQSLNFSLDKSYIGGVSLYNHQYNVHVGSNFQAVDDGYDNWYFQFASSWGQAYTDTQWSDFMAWYETQGILKPNKNIPQNVINWSNKSWLKYNIAYLIEKEKYFLYPKISLTTNFSDKGTHANQDSTAYQVSLLDCRENKDYHFSELVESLAVYDAFFENMRILSAIGLEQRDVCVDLYGYKPTNEENYILTSKILNYKIIKTFGRCLKPMDNNIFQEIEGADFFLYDTSKVLHNRFSKNRVRKIIYNIKAISYWDTLFLLLDLTKTKLYGLFKKLGR